MRIAVPFANGEVYQHFGHTENFKLYEIEAGQVVSSQIIDTNGSGHEALEPGENFLVKVMMINHRVEEAPKTGDDIMIAGSVMTFSAAALVVLLMLKKKKR